MALQHEATDASDRDERLGEAIESYLELAESGRAPEPEAFIASYPDLADELREALDGLALVQGLVGSGTGPGGLGDRRLAAGYRVAGYRIVRELGRGGMGVVYEAVHVDLDRPVALKILGGHAAPGSSGRRRFLNEAKTAAGLHHTHIVPVFDVGQVGGLCYYAMQRIEGSGLDRVLRVLRRDRFTASGTATGRGAGSTERAPATDPRTAIRDEPPSTGLLSVPGRSAAADPTGARPRGLAAVGRAAPRDDRPPPFAPPTGAEYYRWVARVGKQAAEALAYAHRRGVIHRDVKPSNLLVDAKGMVWVADFGLARRLEDPGQTRGDGPVGTPRYMSPEQADGRPVGPPTDIYSLGATLYELLTLRPPFDGQSSAELIRQIVDRDPPPPRRFARRLPRDLETIVLKAMSKRPADRYASAAELAEDLGRFLAFEPVRARRISPLGRAWRLARRHPAAAIVATAAAVAVLVTATVAYVRVASERDRALAYQAQLAEALERQREATRAEQVARAGELLSHLPVLRASTKPRRRDEGRAKLVEAAALAPDDAMRTLLRDEALELLAARDVEDRPALSTGPVRDLLPLGDGGRVAVLRDDGATLSLWDVESRVSSVVHAPPGPADPEADPEPGPFPGPPRRRGGGDWWHIWPKLAPVGAAIAVPNPEGPGILLIDPASGEAKPLALGGAQVVGLLAPERGHRLVTVETVARAAPGPGLGPPPGTGTGPAPGAGRGPAMPGFGVRVRLWSLDASPTPLATLDESRFDELARGSLPLVELDPEGRVVVVGRSGAGQDSSLTIFDLEDGGRLLGFDAGMGLSALDVGPDGLIALAGDGRVLLREVDPFAGSAPIPLPGLIEPRGLIRRLQFNPSGRLIAIVGLRTGVELWDPVANAPVAVIPTQEPVQDVAFADGRTLLVASGSTTEVWSIVEPVGRVGFEFSADAPPRLPIFAPDGLLAMPMLDDPPHLWHPDHCPTRARPRDRPELASAAVAFDRQGHLLAFGPEGLHRFDAATDASPLDALPWPDPAAPASEVASVRLVAHAIDHRAALLFREFEPPADLPFTPRRDRPPAPPTPDPSGPDAPPADRPADAPAAGPDPPSSGPDAPHAERAEPRDPDAAGPGRRPTGPAPRPGGPGGRALGPGGRRGWEPGELWLWRADDGGGPGRLTLLDLRGLRALPDDPRGLLHRAALGPGGRRLLFLDFRGLLHAWDLRGDRPEPIPTPPLEPARSLALAPDGRLLALGGEAGDVRLLAAETFEPIALIPGPDDSSNRRVLGLAFSPDGLLLAVGDTTGDVNLWRLGPDDPPAPRRLLRLPNRRDPVLGLSFSPDGRRLACVDYRSSDDRLVEVWDLATLRAELSSLKLGW